MGCRRRADGCLSTGGSAGSSIFSSTALRRLALAHYDWPGCWYIGWAMMCPNWLAVMVRSIDHVGGKWDLTSIRISQMKSTRISGTGQNYIDRAYSGWRRLSISVMLQNCIHPGYRSPLSASGVFEALFKNLTALCSHLAVCGVHRDRAFARRLSSLSDAKKIKNKRATVY